MCFLPNFACFWLKKNIFMSHSYHDGPPKAEIKNTAWRFVVPRASGAQLSGGGSGPLVERSVNARSSASSAVWHFFHVRPRQPNRSPVIRSIETSRSDSKRKNHSRLDSTDFILPSVSKTNQKQFFFSIFWTAGGAAPPLHSVYLINADPRWLFISTNYCKY